VREYAIVAGKKLRCGYTTGSCAAAAAKAAVIMLLSGQNLEQVQLATPKGIVLNLDLEAITREKTAVTCAIRKDAGDDYDDTNHLLIYAKVEKISQPQILLVGGVGVGRVTKPGLSVPIGEAAINPIPRKMLTTEVEKIKQQYAYAAGLKITIFVPGGEEVAKKTFNPRLGIINGISILGTSGIVEPMSEKALLDTIHVEMDMLKAKGIKLLPVFFGNYGVDFARHSLHLDLEDYVVCSNFIGETLDYAVYSGFTQLLLIGHAGKLIKVAQGVMNTHSRIADCRTEVLAVEALLLGASREVGQRLYMATTTEEALNILAKESILEPVMAKVMKRISYYLTQRVQGKLTVGAIMFSMQQQLLGKNKEADLLLTNLKTEGKLR